MNAVSDVQLTSEQGLLELTLLNAETFETEFEDVVIEGVRRGIPPEILTRLKELWDVSKDIAGEVIAIGKIIVTAIIDFLKANPLLTAGIALGAAVSSLLLAVPFLGSILAPLSMLLASMYGAAIQEGDYSASPITAAVALANKFFELLRLVLNAVSQYWSE